MQILRLNKEQNLRTLFTNLVKNKIAKGLHYRNSAKMLCLLRFRPGCAAGLPKDNALNFAGTVFDCCFIAQAYCKPINKTINKRELLLPFV